MSRWEQKPEQKSPEDMAYEKLMKEYEKAARQQARQVVTSHKDNQNFRECVQELTRVQGNQQMIQATIKKYGIDPGRYDLEAAVRDYKSEIEG